MTIATRMCDALYFELASIVGPELLKAAVPEPRQVNQVAKYEVWTKVQKCVYIVSNRQHDVVYVGSVCRKSPDALCSRMSEHVRLPERSEWWYLTILPLQNSVKEETVRTLEGLIGRRLRYTGNLPIAR